MSDQQNAPGGDQSGQGPQNPYATPSGGDQQQRPQEYSSYHGEQQPSGGSGMAITALVLGILSLFGLIIGIGGFLLGIPAIIVGAIASRKAKKGRATGRGMAITGVITGVIGVVINLVVIAGIVAVFNSESGQTYVECVQQAQDQSEVNECARQFETDLEN